VGYQRTATDGGSDEKPTEDKNKDKEVLYDVSVFNTMLGRLTTISPEEFLQGLEVRARRKEGRNEGKEERKRKKREGRKVPAFVRSYLRFFYTFGLSRLRSFGLSHIHAFFPH
jgi:hypothetical protein